MASRITEKDIYEAISDLRKEINQTYGQRFEKIEGKVDALEDFRNYVMGGMAIITLFVGGLTTWIWSKLTGGGN